MVTVWTAGAGTTWRQQRGQKLSLFRVLFLLVLAIILIATTLTALLIYRASRTVLVTSCSERGISAASVLGCRLERSLESFASAGGVARRRSSGGVDSPADPSVVTRLLRNETPWPSPDRHRVKFVPGTLSMSQSETFQYCHTDPAVYRKHFFVPHVSYSNKFGLNLLLLPKTGSSSGRLVMKEVFEADERKGRVDDFQKESSDGWITMAFVREPLNRFLSAYDEAFIRSAPWVRQHWVHPFPYMHEGINSYDDYEDAFCPPAVRTSRKECPRHPTRENGTLVSRFERFVKEFDGKELFDRHLSLHVPMLSHLRTGSPKRIDKFLNTTDMNAEWDRIAAEKGLAMPQGKSYSGRSWPRRFNVSAVTDKTKRKICRLTALDYCCLNLRLPDVCQAHSDDDREGVFCAVERPRDAEGGGRPRITPWSSLDVVP